MKALRSRKESGQMTIEMILLMVIFYGIAVSVSKYAQDNGLLAKIVEGPWMVVQGMIEDGVWKKAGASKAMHPNLKYRHGTPRGDEY